MAVAESVLLFLATVAWFCIAIAKRDLIASLMTILSAAAGVLQLALPLYGIRIAVGIVTFLEAIGCLALLLFIIAESDGPGEGLAVLLGIGAFLLFAWAVTFGILQFCIVV